MKVLLTAVFLSLSISLSATSYYVSNAGNDGNDGKTEATAWKTISKVNSQTFSPGDVISFKRGDKWREMLTVTSSGNAASYIVYTSYGTGVNPQIIGSTQATTWSATGVANVWKSATSLTTNPLTYGNVWFVETDGEVSTGKSQTYSSTFTNLKSEYDCTWNGNILYIYAASDPDSRYAIVEAAERLYSVSLNSKNYIKFDGIDMHYGAKAGLFNSSYSIVTGLTVRNCDIGFSGYNDGAGYGIHINCNKGLFENNSIHDHGRRGISLYNYTSSNIRNVIIQNNTFYNGYHTTGVDIASGSVSGSTGNIYNVIIRNNLYYHAENGSLSAPSFNSMIGGQTAAGKIDTVLIYNNIFKYSAGAGHYMLGDVYNVSYLNNTFYGFNKTATGNTNFIRLGLDAGNKTITIKNNIFYGDANYSVNTSAVFMVLYGTIAYSDVISDHNLYYVTDQKAAMVSDYSPLTVFHGNDFESLKSAWGWEKNSPSPSDPIFANAPTTFQLAAGSPAIAAGVNVGLATDYDGKSYSATPSIGAYEYGSSTSTPVLPVFQSAVIENATPVRLDMTYNLTLGNVVPATSSFTVRVNSTARTVSSVTVSGTKVQLNLASAVVYGDVVTVSYTAPATNPLQTSAGGKAVSIASKAVTNNVGAINPVYVSSVVENDTPSRIEMTYNMTLTNVAPSASAFKVIVNSAARAVSTVIISDTKIYLSLASPVAFGDVVTVAYTKPATNYLKNTSGGQAASISAQTVVNNVVNPPAGPEYMSSVVENATPTIVEVSFDQQLANVIPSVSSFIVKVNSVAVTVNSVSISGTDLRLSISKTIYAGDIVTVSYVVPQQNAVQIASGAEAAALSNETVTNNSELVAVKNPVRTRLLTAYPNPVTDYVTIRIAGSFTELNTIRFFNMSGTLCLEVKPDPGLSEITIPVNLKAGLYLVQLTSGKTTLFALKISVKK